MNSEITLTLVEVMDVVYSRPKLADFDGPLLDA